ncbi:DNA translocase FtsK, partial [bacterium]|nr:DNA translocase FtsK [bacterium]
YNNWKRLRTFRKQRKKKVLERKILMKRTSVNSDDDEEETPIIREPEDTKITIQKKNDYEEAKVVRTAKVDDGEYIYPPIDILDFPQDLSRKISEKEQIKKAEIIERTLLDFGVEASVVNVNPGPVITLYEVSPAPGVKISKIAGLADDLALSMSARGIRIIAPIPGKSVVGIEIPNKNPSTVYLRALLSSEKFRKVKSKLAVAIGESIDGDAYVFDLAKMPHLLIAGSTGSGTSVGVNTIIVNILYRALPDEVQFALIDPKKLELSIYKKLINHHLLTVDGIDEDVITKPDNAVTLLKCLEKEMEKRYTILAKAGVRNIADFNSKPHKDEEIAAVGKLSYIVVVIDELADLMITSGKEIEESVARLAQMSRAVG